MHYAVFKVKALTLQKNVITMKDVTTMRHDTNEPNLLSSLFNQISSSQYIIRPV